MGSGKGGWEGGGWDGEEEVEEENADGWDKGEKGKMEKVVVEEVDMVQVHLDTYTHTHICNSRYQPTSTYTTYNVYIHTHIHT